MFSTTEITVQLSLCRENGKQGIEEKGIEEKGATFRRVKCLRLASTSAHTYAHIAGGIVSLLAHTYAYCNRKSPFPVSIFLRPTLFTVELMVMRNICTQIIFQGLKLAFIRKLFFHMHAFTCTHTQKPTTSASLNKRQLEASPLQVKQHFPTCGGVAETWELEIIYIQADRMEMY